jgi:hypothetical protein
MPDRIIDENEKVFYAPMTVIGSANSDDMVGSVKVVVATDFQVLKDRVLALEKEGRLSCLYGSWRLDCQLLNKLPLNAMFDEPERSAAILALSMDRAFVSSARTRRSQSFHVVTQDEINKLP